MDDRTSITWATDVHLNFLNKHALRDFSRGLVRADPSAIILSGDISEAHSLQHHLTDVVRHADRPVYFVLGNHDFYGGSIDEVRRVASVLSSVAASRLHWLPAAGVVPLSADTCLVGVDGWGDGRFGNAETTDVILNDFYQIKELRHLTRPELIRRVQGLGDESAAAAEVLLDQALANYRHILFVTHVPPFREACWHEGQISGDDWLPWFSCRAVGDVLRDRLSRHQDRTCTVLCGHTHGQGVADLLPNLRVYTGGAEYRHPQTAGLITIDQNGICVRPIENTVTDEKK